MLGNLEVSKFQAKYYSIVVNLCIMHYIDIGIFIYHSSIYPSSILMVKINVVNYYSKQSQPTSDVMVWKERTKTDKQQYFVSYSSMSTTVVMFLTPNIIKCSYG